MQKYRKPYRIKKKKSIFRNRFFWLTIFIFLFLSALFYVLFFISYFQTKEIKISGNEKTQNEELVKIINQYDNQKILFFYSKSIFLIPRNKIKLEIIRQFPQIKEARLKIKFPDTLLIEIKERKEIGCYCRNQDLNNNEEKNICYFIDGEGIAFKELSDNCPLDLIIKKSVNEDMRLGDKIIEENILKIIQEVNQKMKESLKILISEFNIEDKLIVKTFDGWEIYFSYEKDINLQLTQLKTLLESKIPPENRGSLEYIDLRFNKIFWKFK